MEEPPNPEAPTSEPLLEGDNADEDANEEAYEVTRGREFMDKVNLLSANNPGPYLEGLRALLRVFYPDGIKPDMLRVSQNVLKEIFSVAYKKLSELLKSPSFDEFEKYAELFIIPVKITPLFVRHILTIGFPAQVVMVLKKYSYAVPVTMLVRLIEPMESMLTQDKGVDQVLQNAHIDRHFFLALMKFVTGQVTEDMHFEEETLSADIYDQMNRVLAFLSRIYTNKNYPHHFITQPMLSQFIKKLNLNKLLENLNLNAEGSAALPEEKIYELCNHLLTILGPSTSIDAPDQELVSFIKLMAVSKKLDNKVLAVRRILELAYYFNMVGLYTKEIHGSLMKDLDCYYNILAKNVPEPKKGLLVNLSAFTTIITDNMKEDLEETERNMAKIFEVFAEAKPSLYSVRINLQEFNEKMFHIKENIEMNKETSVLYYKMMTKVLLSIKDGIYGSFEVGQVPKRDELVHDDYDASSIIDSEENSENYVMGNEVEIFNYSRSVGRVMDTTEGTDSMKHVDKFRSIDSDFNSDIVDDSSKFDNGASNVFFSPIGNEPETQTDELFEVKSMGSSLGTDKEFVYQSPGLASPGSARRQLINDVNNPNPVFVRENLSLLTPQLLNQKPSPLMFTPSDHRFSAKSGIVTHSSRLSSPAQGQQYGVGMTRSLEANASSPEALDQETSIADGRKSRKQQQQIASFKDSQAEISGRTDSSVDGSSSLKSNSFIKNTLKLLQNRKGTGLTELLSSSPTSQDNSSNETYSKIDIATCQNVIAFYMSILKRVKDLLEIDRAEEFLIELGQQPDKDELMILYKEIFMALGGYLCAYFTTVGFLFRLLKGKCFCNVANGVELCSTCQLFEQFCGKPIIITGDMIRLVLDVAKHDEVQSLSSELMQKYVDLISAIYSLPAPLPSVFMNIVDNLVPIDATNRLKFSPVLSPEDYAYLSKSHYFMTEILSSLTVAIYNELNFQKHVSKKDNDALLVTKYSAVYVPNVLNSNNNAIKAEAQASSAQGVKEDEKEHLEYKKKYIDLKISTLYRYLLDTRILATLYNSLPGKNELLSLPPTGMKLLNILLKINQIAALLMAMPGVVARVSIGEDNKSAFIDNDLITTEKMIEYMAFSKRTNPGIIEPEPGIRTELSYLIPPTNVHMLCELVATASELDSTSLIPIVHNGLIISALRSGIRNAVVHTNEVLLETSRLLKQKKVRTSSNLSKGIGKDGLTAWMRIQMSKKINGLSRSSGEKGSKSKIPRLYASLCTQILRRMSTISSLRGTALGNVLITDPTLGTSAITGILAIMYMAIGRDRNQKFTILQLYECKRMAIDVIEMIKNYLDDTPNSEASYNILKRELSMHVTVTASKSIVVRPISPDKPGILISNVFDVGSMLTSDQTDISVTRDFIGSNEQGKMMVNSVRGTGLVSWTLLEVCRYWYFVYVGAAGAMKCSRKLMENTFVCLNKVIDPGRLHYDSSSTIMEMKFLSYNISVFIKLYDIELEVISKALKEKFNNFECLEEVTALAERDLGLVTVKFLSALQILSSRPEFNKNIAKIWIQKGIINTLNELCAQIHVFETLLQDTASESKRLINQINNTKKLDADDNSVIPPNTIKSDAALGESNSGSDMAAKKIINKQKHKSEKPELYRCEGSKEAEEAEEDDEEEGKEEEEETEETVKSEKYEDNGKLGVTMAIDAIDYILGCLDAVFFQIKGLLLVVIKNIVRTAVTVKVPESIIVLVQQVIVDDSFSKYTVEQKSALIKLMSSIIKIDLKTLLATVQSSEMNGLVDYYRHVVTVLIESNDVSVLQSGVHMLCRLTKGLKATDDYVEATNNLVEAINSKKIDNKKLHSYISMLTSRFK